MNLPIDEMLLDLRTALEAFEECPSYGAFDGVQIVCSQIERTVEMELDCEE